LNIKLNTDKTAVVSPKFHWLPIDRNTPVGVQMLLIRESAGTATVGRHSHGNNFFTHFAPLPTFNRETT